MDLFPRSASILAIEPCTAIELSTASFYKIYEKDLEQFALIQMNIGARGEPAAARRRPALVPHPDRRGRPEGGVGLSGDLKPGREGPGVHTR